MSDFSQLKPGDTVIVFGGAFSQKYPRKAVVSRVTESQILVGPPERTIRFRKGGGGQVGGDRYHSMWIAMPTPETLKEAERGALLGKVDTALRRAAPSDWSDTKLQRVLDAINSEDKP